MLQRGSVHEVEVRELGLALLVAPLDDASCRHSVGEGVVGDEIIEPWLRFGQTLNPNP